MTEPLGQQNPDDYPEDYSPDLKGIEGGGESTPRETGHLRPLPSKIPEDSASPGTSPSRLRIIKGGGATLRSTGSSGPSNTLSAGQINSREKAGGTGTMGVLPNAEANLVKGGLGSLGPKGPAKGILGLASRMFQSKRARNGGLIGGGIVGIVILLITTFAPVLRLDHLFQNIDNRAFAAAGDAVEHRMEYLFQRYVLLKITGLNSCKAVVSTDCRADYANQGIATNLFNAWRDARVEDKIFNKMGLTVESTKNPDRREGVHRFTLRDRGGNTITFNNEGDWNRFVQGQFKGGKREFGREMRKALRDTTFNLHIMQRKQVRKYLERKHGVKIWCFLACKKKDAAEEKIKDAKTRFKYKFIERFVYPFSPKYGLILDCIISGDVSDKGKCGPKRLEEVGVDSTQLSEEERDRILKDFEENPNLKISQVVLQRLLTKIMSQQAAKTTVSSIPVAGQVYFALVIIDTFDRMDQFIEGHGLSKFAADLNRSQYIQFYQAMRSDSDGLKKGALPLDETGVLVDQFNGAEASCVYQAYNDNPAYKNVALFSTKAFAQESGCNNNDGYTCANDKPIPDGELVCEEKKVARTYAIEDWRNDDVVDGIVGILNGYGRCTGIEIDGHCGGLRPRSVIRPLLDGINWAANAVAGPVVDGILAALKVIPGVTDVLKFATEKTLELLQALMGEVFPLPIALDSPPRDKYDGLEAGGALAASEFGQGGYTDKGDYGQGAPKINKADFEAVYQDYMEQEDYNFKTSSFVNRIANTDEPNSLVSRVASSVPTGLSTMLFSIISAPGNLLNSLANLPDAIFGSSASAQSLAQRQIARNPFNITPHAYPLDHPALTADPSKYTPEYCQKVKQKRIESASEDEITGFEEYDRADPCLLETVTVDSGCTLFVEGKGCLPDEASEEGGSVSGDAQSLAQEIMSSGKVTGDSRYMDQIKAVSNGDFSCNVNPYILEMLVGIVRDGHSLFISSLNRKCTGVLTDSGTASYHYRDGGGHAIDITSFDGQPTTGGGNTVPYWKAAIPYLPDGTGIGQVASCGSGFSLPSGFSPVPDSCNHAHIQVPVKRIGE